MKKLTIKIFLVFTVLILYYVIQLLLFSYDTQLAYQSSIQINDLFDSNCGKERIKNLEFNEKEIQKYWKYVNYDECPKSDSQVYLNGRDIVAKCLNDKPKYNQDLLQPQNLGGIQGSGYTWSLKYERKLEAEFLIVKCSNQKEDFFAFVFNNYKESVFKQAIKKENEFNRTYFKPFSVVLMVFDSVSRASAHMNWPKTISYLKSLGQDSLFFDFKVPTTIGINTRPNIVPILYGQSEAYHDEYLRGENHNHHSSLPRVKSLQEFSIWRFYSELGYSTMFLYDTIFDFMVKSTGRKIYADHVFVNFWKVVYKVFGFHDFSEKQRCLGQQDSHYYSLDYTFQYLTNYKKNNRFAYVHLDAAHENSGNVKTVDKDLAAFIAKTLDWYKSHDQDIVMFFIGDHGRLNPRMQFNIKGFMDQRTPMTFIVSTEGVINKIGAKEILNRSTEELVGRYDINLSLKDLAYFPYERWNEGQYLQLKNSYPVESVLSLFREVPHPKRTCEEIGSIDLYCNIKGFKKIEKDNSIDAYVRDKLIELVQSTLDYIVDWNKEVCNKRKIQDIIVKKFEIMPYGRGWDTIYNFESVLLDSSKIIGSVNFCKFDKIAKTKFYMPIQSYPSTTFNVNSTKVFMQLTNLKLDSPFSPSAPECKSEILIS